MNETPPNNLDDMERRMKMCFERADKILLEEYGESQPYMLSDRTNMAIALFNQLWERFIK